jgi:hypothetical protein
VEVLNWSRQLQPGKVLTMTSHRFQLLGSQYKRLKAGSVSEIKNDDAGWSSFRVTKPVFPFTVLEHPRRLPGRIILLIDCGVFDGDTEAAKSKELMALNYHLVSDSVRMCFCREPGTPAVIFQVEFPADKTASELEAFIKGLTDTFAAAREMGEALQAAAGLRIEE